MITAIYPGSFDPITLGHMDIIERASKIFDKLIVSVVTNIEKKSMFTTEERVDFIRRSVASLPNVEVSSSNRLLAEFATGFENPVVIKGLRNLMDFEFETTMAVFNRKLNPDLETFFITASEKFLYVSSTAVRQLAVYGADLSDYVPECIVDDIINKTQK
ncbi:MAG: pantetheine-phosphate adenylyltransferase [Oscillospiraceae bacterium]